MADLIVDSVLVNTSEIFLVEADNFVLPLNCPTYDTKGTDIMECMLLRQYVNSINLKTYISAYVEEFNLLFTELQKVEVCRQLDYAEGAQLDVIGEILRVPRSANFLNNYFGFQEAEGAESFGEAPDPSSVGGVFKSFDDLIYSVTPLNDAQYKRLLYARAYCVGFYNRAMEGGTYSDKYASVGVEDLFKIIHLIILGTYEDYTNTGIITNFSEGSEVINLELRTATTEYEFNIIKHVKDWFIPITKDFNLTIQI